MIGTVSIGDWDGISITVSISDGMVSIGDWDGEYW